MTISSCGDTKAEFTSQKLEKGDIQEPGIERTDVNMESCLLVQSKPIFGDFDSESSSPTVQQCGTSHGKKLGRLQMAAGHEQERAQDAAGYVECWQEKTVPDAEPDDSEPISRLYNACITLYHDVLVWIRTKICISKVNLRLLERSFSTLLLWGVDFDVSHGSLDRTLKHSHSLRRSTLQLLVSIGKTLSQRLMPFISMPPEELDGILQTSKIAAILDEVLYVVFESNNGGEHREHKDSEESSESGAKSLSDYGTDTFEEIVGDLSANAQSLVDMQEGYEHPAVDFVDEKEVGYLSRNCTWMA